MPVSVSLGFMDVVSQGWVLACANKNGDTLWYAERRQDKVEIRQKAYNYRGFLVPHLIRPSHRVSQKYLAGLKPSSGSAEACLDVDLPNLFSSRPVALPPPSRMRQGSGCSISQRTPARPSRASCGPLARLRRRRLCWAAVWSCPG